MGRGVFVKNNRGGRGGGKKNCEICRKQKGDSRDLMPGTKYSCTRELVLSRSFKGKARLKGNREKSAEKESLLWQEKVIIIGLDTIRKTKIIPTRKEPWSVGYITLKR